MFADGIAVNVVPCTSTPLLIGTDVLRYYGLVLDYAYNTVIGSNGISLALCSHPDILLC